MAEGGTCQDVEIQDEEIEAIKRALDQSILEMAEGGSSKDAKIQDEEIETIEPTLEAEQPGISNITCGTNIYVKNANIVTSGDIHIKNERRKKARPKKSKVLKPLTTSTEQLSLDNLHYISGELGKHWKKLGRRLGFEDGALQQMDEDHQRNYQMLSQWINREGEQATKAQLAGHLADCDLRNLADYLADN